jgi:hypothetical protein
MAARCSHVAVPEERTEGEDGSEHAAVWIAQIDLRSDYERRQDGLGLLVKNARIFRVGRRKGVATLQVAPWLGGLCALAAALGLVPG